MSESDSDAEPQSSEPHTSDQTASPAVDVSAEIMQAPPLDPADWPSVLSDAVRMDFVNRG